VKSRKEIEDLRDKLDSKNTYLHQFKKEEVKQIEMVHEATAVQVRIIQCYLITSLYEVSI
jgi:hypothetical protein